MVSISASAVPTEFRTIKEFMTLIMLTTRNLGLRRVALVTLKRLEIRWSTRLFDPPWLKNEKSTCLQVLKRLLCTWSLT